MWEIFAHGQQPYGETEGNKEIRHGVIHQKVRAENPAAIRWISGAHPMFYPEVGLREISNILGFGNR